MVEYAGSKFSNAIPVSLAQGPITVKNRLGQFHPIYFYKINVSNRSTFNSVLNGLSKNANLALYDNTNKEIASSRNTKEAQDSILRQLDPGTYYIRVNRRDQDTNFTLQLSTSLDVANSFSQAIKVPRGRRSASYQGTVSALDNDSTDFYRFRLSKSSQFTSQLDGLNGNANLSLFQNRRKIAASNNSGTKSEAIDRQLDAGTYYVRVAIRNGSSPYRLRLSFSSSTRQLTRFVSSGADLFH